MAKAWSCEHPDPSLLSTESWWVLVECPCTVWGSWLRLLPLPAVTSTVKQALQESLVQILQPQRRVDMLRDIMDAQRHQRPYVVTFCGVNGVGKSTNLAKVSAVPHLSDISSLS